MQNLPWLPTTLQVKSKVFSLVYESVSHLAPVLFQQTNFLHALLPSLLFFEYTKHTHGSGFYTLLFPLPGRLFPQCVWLIPDLYSNVISAEGAFPEPTT